MSKLLRLTTNDPNCRFDTVLNDEIELPENAEVAFQNLSIEVDKDTLTIDGSNDTITYSFNTGHEKSINLDPETYNEDNISNLLLDIKSKLNASMLVSEKKSIGLQWNVELNNDKKTVIEYKISPYIDFFRQYENGDGALISDNVNWVNTNIRRNGGVIGSNDSYIGYKSIITRGCGVFRCLLKNLTNSSAGNADGVIIGLMKKKPSSSNITIANIFYGIHAWGPNEDYRYIYNGTEQQVVGQKPTIVGNSNSQNDYLEIQNENGNIKVGYYSWDGTQHLFNNVYQDTYNNETPYYPVIIFRGDGTQAQIKNIKFTEDPYTITDSIHTNPDEETLTGVPIPFTFATNNYLEFDDENVAKYIGYNNQRIPTTGTTLATSIQYTGDNTLFFTILGDSFCVLLENIEIDSYDTDTKQRQNILATIPQTDKDSTVIYDAKYLNFIKMRNKNPLKLRNIRARITDNTLGTLNVKGRSVLTILFK